MTSQLVPGSSQADYNKAQAELDELESVYAEMAADTGLAAAGWAPPPWGTAADLISLGRSVIKGDWGGAVLDAIGLVPIAGDAAKAGKLGERAKQLDAAISAAKIKLARHAENLIAARKQAAEAYWEQIATTGRKRYDDAIRSCSTQSCKDKTITLLGEHYKKTPIGGPGKGRWTTGQRGDGIYRPDPTSPAGLALDKFSKDPVLNPSGKQIREIPYRNGFPDYSQVVVPAGAGRKAEVEIIQAGNHSSDYEAADKALQKATGKTKRDLEKELKAPLVWHHKEDGVTMQLLPTYVHGGKHGTGHAGGASLEKQEEF